MPAQAAQGPASVLDVYRLLRAVSDLRTSDAARRAMRRYLEARDGRVCVRCGDAIDRGETPSIGHVIARALGGSDAPSNLRLEHLDCNRRAGVSRDRARLVTLADVNVAMLHIGSPESARIRVDGELGPVFQQARAPRAEPKSARNGARNGPIRTDVLYRRAPRR
jgi:hypothetical protein